MTRGMKLCMLMSTFLLGAASEQQMEQEMDTCGETGSPACNNERVPEKAKSQNTKFIQVEQMNNDGKLTTSKKKQQQQQQRQTDEKMTMEKESSNDGVGQEWGNTDLVGRYINPNVGTMMISESRWGTEKITGDLSLRSDQVHMTGTVYRSPGLIEVVWPNGGTSTFDLESFHNTDGQVWRKMKCLHEGEVCKECSSGRQWELKLPNSPRPLGGCPAEFPKYGRDGCCKAR